MIRPWPKSLSGQMISLLLLALIVSQGVTLAIYLGERHQAVRSVARGQVLSRTVSTVRLLADTPAALSTRIAETASGPRLGFWLSDESAVDPKDEEARGHPLQRRLLRRLEGTGAQDALVRVEERAGFLSWSREERRAARFGADDEPRAWRNRDHREFHRRRRPLNLTLSVQLADGRWLNAATLVPFRAPAWAWPSLASMFAMAVAIALIVILSVRRITRPMRALAAAADSFGRGQDTPPLPEAGPADIRRTIHAFNDMRQRLARFVQDRTQMLAAISHDLRTPITSLRLRAEFIEDAEVRDKILETLDEMQAMTEAALAFAREDAAQEDTRKVDLGALVQSLCDDLAEGGDDVTFVAENSFTYACRPVALRRALRNLIENAVAYGEKASITLAETGDGPVITIDDQGPGIPEARFDQVFEPFVRLEASRSRETGGVGLGLAIARSILRAHGGDIELQNRPEGGLRVIVRLPGAARG